MATPVAPSVFVAHGSPMFGIAAGEYGETLRRFATRFPRPAAIVVVSAHWEAPGPVRVNAVKKPDLIYDFGGFPPALYELTYPAPGSPGIAEEALTLLADAGIPAAREDQPRMGPRRLDSAAPPLSGSRRARRRSLAAACRASPTPFSASGAALAPLRRQNVLLLGSGGIVHNLRLARLDRETGPVDDWARAFDAWVRERIEARDFAALARYRELAPDAELAVPETEHFDPLLFAAGATREDDRIDEIATGFQYANLSLSSYAFAPK